MILINVPEEAIQTRIRDGNPGTLEGLRELRLVEVAVAVAVNGLEEHPQLLLGLVAELHELVVAYLTVVVDVAGREHISDETVRVFEGCGGGQAVSRVIGEARGSGRLIVAGAVVVMLFCLLLLPCHRLHPCLSSVYMDVLTVIHLRQPAFEGGYVEVTLPLGVELAP